MCQILRLLPNILAADDKYLVLTREKLTRPIEMPLSQKQKAFYEFFSSVWKCGLDI